MNTLLANHNTGAEMTLADVKAECEKHESRADGAHARMDKLSNGAPRVQPDEDKGGGKTKLLIAAIAAAAILIVASLLTIRGTPPDGPPQHGPTIDSWSIEQGTRTPVFKVNASDLGDNITEIRIQVVDVNPRTGADRVVLNFSYPTDSRSVRMEDSLDFNSGKTLQGGNRTNVDGYLKILVSAFDLEGNSGGHEYSLELPSVNSGPVCRSQTYVSGPNGLRVSANYTDSDDDISNITVLIYVNSNPLEGPVLEELYWVNQSAANITDTIFLDLPAGSYVVTSYATDIYGKESAFAGWKMLVLTS